MQISEENLYMLKYILIICLCLMFSGCDSTPNPIYTPGDKVIVNQLNTEGIFLSSEISSWVVIAKIQISYMDENLQMKTKVVEVNIRYITPVKTVEKK